MYYCVPADCAFLFSTTTRGFGLREKQLNMYSTWWCTLLGGCARSTASMPSIDAANVGATIKRREAKRSATLRDMLQHCHMTD